MVKLSVVIITYNEERNIERCLSSVQDISDETVVVDSFSTDKTEEICKRYNVRFIQHKFEGYIQQKNWAAQQARHDHILSLDADEALSDKLKESIAKTLKNFKYSGYYFNRQTNYCGKWIKYSWYPDKKLRLWDRQQGGWGGINPHDKIILQKGSTQKYLKGDILHYSYYTIQEHINQVNRFSDISAHAYFQRGQKATYFNIIFNPLWRLVRDYLFKAGFLDGFFGLVICINAAHETFLKYVKLKQIIDEEKAKKRDVICFFNTSNAWGGGEKWHCDIAERMAKNGYKVMIFTGRHSPLNARSINIAIKKRHTKVSNLSFLNVFKVLYISNILKINQVKTIITNLSYDFKVAGIAAKLAGVKNIIYRKGSAIPVRNTSLNRYLYRDVATCIIANSKETKRNVFINNANLIPQHKVKVIYNGLDLKLYKKNTKTFSFSYDNDEIILGNAGRFSEEKGQIFLVELAKMLKDKKIRFKLLLAGSGKLENKIKKLVENLGLENEVIFLGFINEIPAFMETLDIYILTSLWEGFGYVMVEAMAKSKPVVAFDIKSSSEIVKHNETGYIVDKKNITELAEKTEILIKDSNLRKKFGEAGRKQVEKHFNLEKTFQQVVNVIT